MRCPECDAQVGPDDAHCPVCGCDLPRSPERKGRPHSEVCSICGAEWDTGDEICPSCGCSIYGDSPAEDEECV